MAEPIAVRRCRRTRTLVALFTSEALFGAPNDDAPWATTCEEHGTIATHRTRRLALSSMSNPAEWCGACRGENA